VFTRSVIEAINIAKKGEVDRRNSGCDRSGEYLASFNQLFT
jgi:hypothetical protein